MTKYSKATKTEIVWTSAKLDVILRAWADQYTTKGKDISLRNWCVDRAKNLVVFSFYSTDKAKGE